MKKLKIPDQLIGLLMYIAFEIFTKAILYPYITKYNPLFMSALLAFLFNFIFRYLMIVVYDTLKRDFFWIELLKYKIEQKQEIVESSSITKKIIKYKKFGNGVLFLILFCTDPFMTVLYYRKGNHVWNNIPNIKLFLIYLGSTTFCSVSIIGIFEIIFLIIGEIKSII